ncbi:hypothetical protein [Mesorhizobium sp. M1027]|uniref:hypothetical protein n=1 Tax=Mesorhizobium sp. M1027 TaxID=2957050 RepID=UPI00333C0841
MKYVAALVYLIVCSPATAQDQKMEEAVPNNTAVTGMGVVIATSGPSTGPWTNGNSTGLSQSACQPGEYAVGVEVDGADSNIRYCVGCVARLRVICQRMP